MRLSLATRIFLGYAVVLVTFGAVSVFSVTGMHQSQSEIRLISQGYLPLVQDAAEIASFHKNREKDTAGLIQEKSVETRRAMIRLARLYFPPLIAQKLDEARAQVSSAMELAPASESDYLGDVDRKLADLRQRYGEYEQAANGVFTSLESTSPSWSGVGIQMDRLKQMENSIGISIRVLEHSLETRMFESVGRAEARGRRAVVAIIALSVLAIAVGLLATAISARTLRPVRTLIEGVSRIGRGDYGARLGLTGEDEISVLAREFDAMARSLREREAQLRENQEALLRAEQLAAVGKISAQIAHEVRNPLSSIGLNTEMLQEALQRASFTSESETREARELLTSVVREVDRLTEVTEHYLKMARLPAPALAPESVNDVISSVLDFSREELARSNVEIEARLDPSQPRALADGGQLRQVFLNLVRNSREAMFGAGGGRLTVRSSVFNGTVEVAFSDTGAGISRDVQDHIFDPFFSTKQGGTGLGLAVSRQIVQAHGGSIACESAPGLGTTFVIRLQRAST